MDSEQGITIGLACAIGITAIATIIMACMSYTQYNIALELGAIVKGDNKAAINKQTMTAEQNNWNIEFSDIELGETLGSGSIGTVQKGRWRGLTVAAKAVQLSKNDMAKPEKLFSAFQLLRKVRHPNLVLFMGISTEPASQRIHVVSEYMEKRSLYNALHTPSIQISYQKRIQLGVDIALALNYLHHMKHIHAHITSFNVLIDEDWVAKVSDYGLDAVRQFSKNTNKQFMQPLWEAPELLKKSSKPSEKTDVYSYSIVLYELLTSLTPYQGKINASNTISAVNDIVKGVRPDIPARLPDRLKQLLQRSWSMNAEQRPTLDQIIVELQACSKIKFDMTTLHDVTVGRSGTGGGQSACDTISDVWQREKKQWMIQKNEFTIDTKNGLLGAGSFGTVYTGMFRGKKVAVKKLTIDSSSKIDARTSTNDMVRELNLMCSMRHPNTVLFIAACLTIDSTNNTQSGSTQQPVLYIIMELAEQGNLQLLLANPKVTIDYNRIISVLLGVTDGLLYLHSYKPSSIIHADMKSANILIDQHWNVKISDFGLTHVKSGSATTLNVGTPFYQSPETLENNVSTVESDVYSLGMVMLEMFTREIPFNGMTPHQAVLQIINDNARPTIPQFVPPRFAALIQQCWTRDPTKRPKISHIKTELQAMMQEGLPRIELTRHPDARLYRKKLNVFAFKSKDAVIVYKPWGTGEGKLNDYVIVGPGDDVYTCDAAIFHTTYASIDPTIHTPDHRPSHLYRKTGQIYALEMRSEFLMETLEGMEHGAAGDFIAQNPVEREQWPIAGETFKQMYELCTEQKVDTVAKMPNGHTAG